MSGDDVPKSGVVIRNAAVPSVLVGRFDEEALNGRDSAPTLMPDFVAAKPPLRMKVTTTQERSRGPGSANVTQETLSLQDASGQHTFSVVLVKEPGPDPSGNAVYSAMPVSGWYNFGRSSSAPQLDPEEQAALFEQLQSLRRRPTAADSLRAKLRGGDGGDPSSISSSSLGGRGGSDLAGDDDGDMPPGQDTYRTAMAAAAASSTGGSVAGRGGPGPDGLQPGASTAAGDGGVGGDDHHYGGGGEGVGGPGDFLDDAYAHIDAPPSGSYLYDGGGGGGQDGSDVGGDGGLQGGGREFDVVGMEGGGEEVAIDYEPDWDDDAGDKGDMYADAHAEGGVLPILSAADLAQGEAALSYDGAEAAEREDEEDEGEGGDGEGGGEGAAAARRAAEAAAAASSAAAHGQGEELEAGRAVKRARLEASTPLGQLKEELKRLVVSMGGRITMKIVSKHYKKRIETEGKSFQDLLLAALKSVTCRVLLADKSMEYMLKDSA